MLLRMYVRWGKNQRFKTKVAEKSMGEEDGTKSATIDVEGRYVYGYISGEKGTHHIVQQYSKGLLQDSLNVEIQEENLEYTYYRAGGKGGQNINKVESAIQITHIPILVTVCFTDCSSKLRGILDRVEMIPQVIDNPSIIFSRGTTNLGHVGSTIFFSSSKAITDSPIH
ncbi:hypothetical protein OROMI_027828 [Orobanche minor]